MTPADRQIFRQTILRILDANAATRWGLGVAALRVQARAQGHSDLDPGEVAAELRYLEDKGLVTPVDKLVSPDVPEYRITAQGRDYYASLTNG